jgi:hypothetical protein
MGKSKWKFVYGIFLRCFFRKIEKNELIYFLFELDHRYLYSRAFIIDKSLETDMMFS